MRAATTALAAWLLVALAGCGGDERSDGDRVAAAAPPRTIDLGAGPSVEVPGGSPPRRLVVKDLRKGSGAAASRGDELTVEYLGVRWGDGSRFTNSWDRSKPFRFVLGGDNIMINPGWHEGIAGMRVGGRRQLIVPPKWQYEGGAPPELGPDDTLVYVIDLVSIR